MANAASGKRSSEQASPTKGAGGDPRDPKRRKTTTGAASSGSKAPAAPAWSSRSDLFDDKVLANVAVPDSKAAAPAPLPTKPSRIDPTTGDPIATAPAPAKKTSTSAAGPAQPATAASSGKPSPKAPATSTWRSRSDLFDDKVLANDAVPDSKAAAPTPLPTKPSSIDPATGDPIVPGPTDAPGSGNNATPKSRAGSATGVKGSSNPPRALEGLSRQALFERIQNASARLTELANNKRPCNCPPQCPGLNHRSPPKPNTTDEEEKKTDDDEKKSDDEEKKTDDKEKKKDDDDVIGRANILAEVEGAMDVELYNTNPPKGRIRMSLQVHDDPLGHRSRLGYYGRIFLTYLDGPKSQEQQVGVISGWRISKPSWYQARKSYPHEVWVEEWLRSQKGRSEERCNMDAKITKDVLGRLYDQDGQPKKDSFELGDKGNEIVVITMVSIHPDLMKIYILDPCLELYFRLCMGGTLPQWFSPRGTVTFLVEAGVHFGMDESRWSEIWLAGHYPQEEEESPIEYVSRIASKLKFNYQMNGFEIYEDTPGYPLVMGKIVQSVRRDENDRLVQVGTLPPSSRPPSPTQANSPVAAAEPPSDPFVGGNVQK